MLTGMEYRETEQIIAEMGLSKAWLLPRFCFANKDISDYPEEMLVKGERIVFGHSAAKPVSNEESLCSSCVEHRYLNDPDLENVTTLTWERLQPVVDALKTLMGAENRGVLHWLFSRRPPTAEEKKGHQSLKRLTSSRTDVDPNFDAFKVRMSDGAKRLPDLLPVPIMTPGERYFKVYENGLFDNKAFTVETLVVGGHRLRENDGDFFWEAGLYYPDSENDEDISHWVREVEDPIEGLPTVGNNCRLFSSKAAVKRYLEDATQRALAALS